MSMTERDPDCPQCNGTRTVCWACGEAIDECECGEDQEPSPCERCCPMDDPSPST